MPLNKQINVGVPQGDILGSLLATLTLLYRNTVTQLWVTTKLKMNETITDQQ